MFSAHIITSGVTRFGFLKCRQNNTVVIVIVHKKFLPANKNAVNGGRSEPALAKTPSNAGTPKVPNKPSPMDKVIAKKPNR